MDGTSVVWEETLFKVLQGVLAKPKLGLSKVRAWYRLHVGIRTRR